MVAITTDLLVYKDVIGTLNYGLVTNEIMGILAAIVLCYFITRDGEEVRILFLPMLFIANIIGFTLSFIGIGIGTWIFLTTILNPNTYGGGPLNLFDQSNKKRNKPKTSTFSKAKKIIKYSPPTPNNSKKGII